MSAGPSGSPQARRPGELVQEKCQEATPTGSPPRPPQGAGRPQTATRALRTLQPRPAVDPPSVEGATGADAAHGRPPGDPSGRPVHHDDPRGKCTRYRGAREEGKSTDTPELRCYLKSRAPGCARRQRFAKSDPEKVEVRVLHYALEDHWRGVRIAQHA
jgi:hypothetical protein